MVSGTLYAVPGDFRTFKVQIAARFAGSDVSLASNFALGQTNKTGDFLRKFPLGKVPAFESKDGQCIFESNAIAHFVANDVLRGQNPKDQAEILQWMNFAENEVLPASATWVFPCMGIMAFNKQAVDHAKEDVKRSLGALDAALQTRTYLVGERISLADIVVACDLLHLYQWVLEPSFRQSYGNVDRWFTTMINQSQFREVIGEFKLCEKMAQFDAKKFAELSGGKKKEEGAKKEEKPKQEKPKKEKQAGEKKEKKEETPVDDDMDAVEAALAGEPKKKDPFDDLPPTTFNFETFKRVYSNEDTLTKALPWFWEHFDKQNCSIWYSEYKFTEELKAVYMSCNLITGMFQRLDKMRKCSFASVLLFGKDNDSTISGIWVWRGQDLPFKLTEDWQVDYESYAWKKLDSDAPATKVMVQEYFTWEGKFEGQKPFNQGKIFK